MVRVRISAAECLRVLRWPALALILALGLGGCESVRQPSSPTLIGPAVEQEVWLHGDGRACDSCHAAGIEPRGEEEETGLEARVDAGEEEEPAKGGEEEGEGGADNRASLFIRQRAYPLDSIPFGARLTAYEEALKMEEPKLAATERWENIGPAPMRESAMGSQKINVSGRVTAIAVDPRNSNVAYAGAALGGVWKTTDAGKSWVPLTDNQASLATGDIAIDPSNPNTIYVGTGEAHGSDSYYGAGLLKSVNAGQTWTLLGEKEFAWAGITRVIVDPKNSQTIYVSTANYSGVNVSPPTRPWAGIFKSTNGGVSFTRLLGCDYDGGNCRGASDLVMNPQNPQILYAAFWGRGIYKTTNGGAKWQQIDQAGANVARIELAISPSNPAVLYAGYSISSSSYQGIVMLKSTNSGANWAQLTNAPNYCASQCNYDNIITVHPTNPNTVYVGGSANYIWEPVTYIKQVLQASYDGGNTWKDLSPGDRPDHTLHPDMHVITIDPHDPKIIWAGTDGGIRRSTDGGATWQDANGNLATLQFTGVAAHPTNPQIAFGGMQDNNKAITTGGVAWLALDAGDGGFAAIDPFEPRYLYGTRYRLQFQRNDNSGSPAVSEWPLKVSGINPNDRLLFYSPFALDPSTKGVLYWGTYRLYRTANRGESWTVCSGDLTNGWAISAIAVAPTDPKTIYVGSGDGKVSVTKNTGGAWTNVTKAPLPNRYVSDIAVKNGAPGTAYVVYNGFDQHTPNTHGHVFKTTNFGQSWANISANLPDIPVLSIALDKDHPNVLYIGTDIGVFRSRDDGKTWEQFNAGMANCSVTDLALNPVTDVLLAATHGRSVYRMSLAPVPTEYKRVLLPSILRDYQIGGPARPTPTRTTTAVHSFPTPTATRKATATPTTPPTPITGSITTFVDNFGYPASGWYIGTTEGAIYGYADGEYAITSAAGWTNYAWAPSGPHKDGTFQVTAREEDPGSVHGLIFGSDSTGEAFYVFAIYPDEQQYALAILSYGSQTMLVDWTDSPAIAAGTGKNILKVIRSGATIKLYCNNVLLATADQDQSLRSPGWTGLMNWSLEAATTAYFDDMSISTSVRVAAADDFGSAASGWATGTSDDGLCSASYTSGEYALNTSTDSACYSIAPTDPFVGGVYEVTARRASSTYPTAYGLMFAVDGMPPFSYMLFWINPDSRTYCFLGYDGVTLYALVDWTESAAINAGVGANRIRVIRDGAQIHLYVNDFYLISYVTSALSENGYLGLLNWASPYEPVVGFFDDFDVATWGGATGISAEEKGGVGYIGSAPLPVGPFGPAPMPAAGVLPGTAFSGAAPEQP